MPIIVPASPVKTAKATPNLSESTGKNLLAGLPFKKTRIKTEWHKRVLFLDPTEIYCRISIKPWLRVQTHLTFPEMFPVKADGTCACGCGVPLSGRRRRWATSDCTKFATTVFAIIDGQTKAISTFTKKYFGARCRVCGTRKGLKADHVVPVKHGGGGCWLSNFQLLCHSCHVTKTNQDFGWKQLIPVITPAENNAVN